MRPQLRWKPSLYLFICATFPGFSAVATEITGSPDELTEYLRSDVRTVSLQKRLTETTYTDLAKITLVVSTEGKQLSSAIAENTRLRETMIRSLTTAGIPADKIKSSKYSASPQYGWFGRSPSSFDVVNSLVVEVSSERQFLAVSELADADDSVSFGGVDFELGDEDGFEDQVREKALEAVLSDATFFEERLGLKLEPVAFSYSPIDRQGRNRNSGFIEEVIVTASRGSSAKSAPALPPPTFDEVELMVSVQVTFEVVRGQE